MENKIHFRLIGDVHGNIDQLVALGEEANYSLCVGDVGFNYRGLHNISSDRLKICGGNHDNYELWEGIFISQPPHFLGDYGVHTVPGFGDFFYVRGGHSIDKDDRVMGRNWWPEEELSYPQGWKAIEAYEAAKPKIMVTHECPSRIIPFVAGRKSYNGVPIQPSRTANLLDTMFDIHQPELWIFGHHHTSFTMEHRGTKFQCLDILECLDFERKATDD